MNYTPLRLRALADAAAAVNRHGLVYIGGGSYADEQPGSERHMAQVVQPMERKGLLQRYAGGVLHITELGEQTLDHWREIADRNSRISEN